MLRAFFVLIMTETIKLGISSCLLGNNVRYDGGHKLDRFITGTLGKYFEWLPVCPEVEAGLSIPREPMQLAGDPDCPRLLTIGSGIDLTGVINDWAGKNVKRLAKKSLCGFILKSRSPSCAINDANLFTPSGKAMGNTSGLFSALVKKHDPHLPVIDEEDLADPALCENFIERVFLYNRWLVFTEKKPSLGNLVSFHSDHKLRIMAQSPKHYSALGKLVAGAKGTRMHEVYKTYFVVLMDGMRLIATPKKNANVLMHVMGYFKKQLSAVEKKKLLEVIEQYRNEQVPLIVPITLLKHYVRKYDEPYLKRQHYLNPHPMELMLRNHV